MISRILKVNILLVLFASLFVLSCEKEEIFSDDDGYYQLLLDEIDDLTAPAYTADLAEYDMAEEPDPDMQALMGRRPCFTFIFPIYLNWPTQNAPIEVNSQEDLRQLLHKWKENYPDSNLRPTLVFPLKIMMRDGTIIKVESPEHLAKIKARCEQDRPDLPKFKLCFDPLFPLNVKMPDGTIVTVGDPKALHELFQKWHLNATDVASRPEIVFPIKVKTHQGEIIVIKNMDELKRYLKDCIQKLRKNRPHTGNGVG